ncbi:Cell surface antigen I/II precursor [Planctomycetes bacterium CA13]|uniref:Cell surface antigen I/II n=1 Tax=Novipirellula herctigrandis TaxID=2527986 RepID=A0A5C5Z3K8_9BACT|nr:Cell surface antigen I/II precursor [Planctomycetes bacterium CA13]
MATPCKPASNRCSAETPTTPPTRTPPTRTPPICTPPTRTPPTCTPTSWTPPTRTPPTCTPTSWTPPTCTPATCTPASWPSALCHRRSRQRHVRLRLLPLHLPRHRYGGQRPELSILVRYGTDLTAWTPAVHGENGVVILATGNDFGTNPGR